MVKYNKINAKLSDSQLNKLKSATRQTNKLRNAIENNMATDIKLRKAQISKMIQSGGFLGKLLGPLLNTGLPLLKSVIKPLGLLGLTATSSAIDAGVQKNTWLRSSFRLRSANSSSNNLKSRNE